MTMRLTIHNEDPSRAARVTTIDFEGTPAEVASLASIIEPGDDREFWIHAGRTLRVEEVQSAPEEPKS